MTILSAFVRYVAAPILIANAVLYAFAILLPASVGGGHPKRLANFLARAFAFIWSLMLCATFGLTSGLLLMLVGKAGLTQWIVARTFKYVMATTCQVWMEVEDEHGELKTKPPMVLVGNHQTELDILFCGHLFPPNTSVTSKSSLKWVPLLGQFMWASMTIFIDRANSKSARAAFDSAANQMKTHRQSVFIFAEGTRSYSLTPTLLPFKKGAFHLAVQAQVPLVPAVCENYAHVLVMKGGWKKWKFVPGTIRVKVLKKVETNGLDSSAVDGMASDVRGRMLSCIEEMGRQRAMMNGGPIAMKANGKSQ